MLMSAVSPDELRARQRRAFNEETLAEELARDPDEVCEFDCECGDPDCTARIRLTPREFATFRRNFNGFLVATGHEFEPQPDPAALLR